MRKWGWCSQATYQQWEIISRRLVACKKKFFHFSPTGNHQIKLVTYKVNHTSVISPLCAERCSFYIYYLIWHYKSRMAYSNNVFVTHVICTCLIHSRISPVFPVRTISCTVIMRRIRPMQPIVLSFQTNDLSLPKRFVTYSCWTN